MWAAVALVLGASAPVPFEDTLGRFTLELPPGWEYAPQPGDVRGATFRVRRDGVPAHLSVRVLDISPLTSLAQVVDGWEGGVREEFGFRRLETGNTAVGGVSGKRQRYVVLVTARRDWTKMAEYHAIVVGARAYIIHMECLAEVFAGFEADLRSVVASFRLPRGFVAEPPGGRPSDLVGSWAMEGAEDTVFVFNADGTFELAGVHGRFSVEGNRLRTRPREGGAEIFRWKIDGDRLVLSGPNLPTPMAYRRLATKEPSTRPDRGPTLAGRWIADGLSVRLSPGGAVEVDGLQGTYTRDGGLLKVTLGRERSRELWEFSLRGDRLRLRGGRFGAKGVELSRSR